MNPIGRRIKQLRKQHKLTQNDVAAFIGVQRVSVSKWESQSDVFNTPKGEHLFKLAQILETSVEYILYGRTKYHPSTQHQPILSVQENTGLTVNKIPVIDWDDIGNINKSKSQKIYTNQVVFSHLPNTNQSFALTVIGDSMVSTTGPHSFPDGVLIVFDPALPVTLSDGIFIIAQINQDMMFRQVKFDGLKPYLHALNPQYPKVFEPFKVIGKVTEMQMPLP